MIIHDHGQVVTKIERSIVNSRGMLTENLAWLESGMHPYFFFCNSEDIEEVAVLVSDLHLLSRNQRFTLADSDTKISIAQLGVEGALYSALRSLPEKPIAYAQLHTSYGHLPGTDFPLEVLECDF
ncbi:MAG: amino acid dehydrogenase, partial [Pseudomonadota bacterium]